MSDVIGALALLLAISGKGSPSDKKPYWPAGSTEFDELPTPTAALLGATYNVTDAFVTDSRFVEGSGISYPAGTDVCIMNAGTEESPVYKYNVYAGGYVTDSELSTISTNPVQNKVVTAAIGDNVIANSVSGDAVSVTYSADGYVQNLTVYGRSHVSKNLFNKDAVVHGWIREDGSLRTDGAFGDNYRASDYIATNDNTYICITGLPSGISSSAGFAFYDSNKGFISVIPLNTIANNPVVQVPSNARFFRISPPASAVDQIMISYGSTIIPYEPYGIIGIGDSGSLTITTANSDSSESSTATLTTGLPLCGIPVDSGETYTDGDGVKWLADSANVESIIKRSYKVTFDGSADENVQIYSGSATGADGSKAFYINLPYASVSISTSVLPNIITNYNIDTAQNGYDSTSQYDTLVYTSTDGVNLGGRIAGAATVSAIKNALASNPVTVVYELATPYEIPLAASEIAQLRALKTYNPTTNVTITDDPTVDISYIKNTANGKAVADMQTDLQAQIIAIPAFIASIPEMHRNILRGKYLGSAVSAAQFAAIVGGSFDDLYVEDYWTIPVTIDSVTKNINWRIADIDYYLHAGDTPLEAHHLVIVPDTGLYAARMNATNTNSGGYKASEMYTTNLGTAKTAINTAFPNMVLSHRDLMPGNPADSPTWADSTAELLSEIMVYGTQIFSPCNGSGQYNNFLTIAKSQLALFRLAPWFGVADDTYWLRDVVGDPSFAAVSAEGNANGWGASNEKGVRPYFLLGSAE